MMSVREVWQRPMSHVTDQTPLHDDEKDNNDNDKEAEDDEGED